MLPTESIFTKPKLPGNKKIHCFFAEPFFMYCPKMIKKKKVWFWIIEHITLDIQTHPEKTFGPPKPTWYLPKHLLRRYVDV